VRRCNKWNDEVVTSGVTVFTDGSVYNGSVGVGACAAVLFPSLDGDEKLIQTCAVGKKVSSFTCEVRGIVLGMSMVVDYFSNLNNISNMETVHIVSDSCAAIEAVDRCNRFVPPGMFRVLIDLRQLLYDMNIRIVLVQIQGHSGILGNDIADKEAKLTAVQMFKGIVAVPDECVLSMSEAYRMSSEITGKSWQRLWDNESTGRYTYDLIPVVNTKVTFSKFRDIGIAYCRMLLHDTMLKKDSHRTGTSDTPLCECGQADESVEHFLLYCGKYAESRKVMMDIVRDLASATKSKQSLKITEHLLLAPYCDDISKRDNLFIKEALFEFISSCNRNI